MAVKIKVKVWVVTPCNFVVGYQCFRGPCCFHKDSDTHWVEGWVAPIASLDAVEKKEIHVPAPAEKWTSAIQAGAYSLYWATLSPVSRYQPQEKRGICCWQ